MLDPAIDEEDENLTALLNRMSSQSTPAAAVEEMRKPLSRVGVAPADDTKAIRLASADRRAAQQSDATTGLLGDIGNASTSLLEGLTLTKIDRPKPMQPQAEARMVAEVGDEQQRARDERLMAIRELEAEARGRPKPAPVVKAPAPVNPEKEQADIELKRARARYLDRPPAPRAPKAPKPGAGAPDGKMLPAGEVSSLSELPVAESQVDNLVGAFKRLNMGGMSGRASGAVTDIMGLRFTDAAEYNAAAKLAMQAAGKIMEGGKLAAGDEAKYAAMLPRPGDSDAVVQQKAEGLKAFLRDLAGRRAQAFKDSGYNVAPSLMPQAAPAAAAPAQDENAKALAWANANPNDPRAAAIKARLGAK